MPILRHTDDDSVLFIGGSLHYSWRYMPVDTEQAVYQWGFGEKSERYIRQRLVVVARPGAIPFDVIAYVLDGTRLVDESFMRGIHNAILRKFGII